MHRLRPIQLLVCVLALATGLALFATASLVTVPLPAAAPTAAPRGAEEANAALGWRFYDAVNVTLRTGDPTLLADLVAADFAGRTNNGDAARTRDELVRRLLALHATFPAIRLAVEDVQAHGDWVQAQVSVEGGADGAFLDIRLSGGPDSWKGVELLRIAGGQIAERWAADDWPEAPRLLAHSSLPEQPESAFIRLVRLIYGPESSQPRAGALGPLLIAVEAGALTARPDGPAVLTRAPTAEESDPPPSTVPPGDDVALHPGDGLLILPGVGYAFRNDEPTPPIVLALALLPWSSDSRERMEFHWPAVGSPGVATHLLADGVPVTLPACPATLAMARLTLAAEVDLTPNTSPWLRLAIVEAGTLGLARTGSSEPLLTSGPGTLVEVAAGTRLRGVGGGPLTLLLLTIAPATSGGAC